MDSILCELCFSDGDAHESRQQKEFLLPGICYTIRKLLTPSYISVLHLSESLKTALVFLGTNYGSTYSMSKCYNRNLIHFNGTPVKTYSVVFQSKDVIVLLFIRRKIKGRDKNPTPCKIQYPMKNCNQRYFPVSH